MKTTNLSILDISSLDLVTGGCRPAPGASSQPAQPNTPNIMQGGAIDPSTQFMNQFTSGGFDPMALLVGLSALFDLSSELDGAGATGATGNAVMVDPIHGEDVLGHADVATASHDGELIQATAAEDHSHDAGLISGTELHQGHFDLSQLGQLATLTGAVGTHAPVETRDHRPAADQPVTHDHRGGAATTEASMGTGTPFTGVGTWHQMTAK
jgi:hypothetical protein